MSLRRKMIFKDVALGIGLVVMGAGCLCGLLQQRAHVRASLGEYAALQRVQVAQLKLVSFQQSLHAGQMRAPQSIADLQMALRQLREYKALVSQYDSVLPAEITGDLQIQAKEKTRHLVSGLVQLAMAVDPPRLAASKQSPDSASLTAPKFKSALSLTPADPAALSASIDQLCGELAELLSMCNGFVHRTQLAADSDLKTSILLVASVAGCTVLLAVFSSIWQYRRMMLPLQRLRQWCRLTTQGDFSVAYQPTADREFQELGRDVNQMAAELDAFTRKMEFMVATKSRELIRSERLASVGYLAAGVAHEINNPLNIISGYAELTLKRLRKLDQPESDGNVTEHLSIIRSEAFRCKEITQKLLSLAKGSGDSREPISLSDAVTDVIALVRGLKGIRHKHIEVLLPQSQPLVIQGNLTEIKQVLLNLIINAIEAVPERTGKIKIESYQSGEWMEVNVIDNGRGMTPEVAQRVFEPFFTHKRGAGEPGTGLGLSITHAIVCDHRGEILVHSEGPNRGSRFTVRFPASASQMLMRARSSDADAIIRAVNESQSAVVHR